MPTRANPLTRVVAATLLCVAATLAGVPQAGASTTSTEPGTLSWNGVENRLTGTVPAGTSIETVLRRIGDAAGIDVKISADLGTLSRDLPLAGLSVEEALRRIMAVESMVLFYDDAIPDAPTLQKVWIIAKGEARQPLRRAREQQRALPGYKNLPVHFLQIQRGIGIRDVVFLSQRGDDDAIAMLRVTAVEGTDARVRRSAINALASVDGQGSFGLFVSRGLNDPDPIVRVEAARSLVRIDNVNSVSAIRNAARRETDDKTRDILLRLAAGETVPREVPKSSNFSLHKHFKRSFAGNPSQ